MYVTFELAGREVLLGRRRLLALRRQQLGRPRGVEANGVLHDETSDLGQFERPEAQRASERCLFTKHSYWHDTQQGKSLSLFSLIPAWMRCKRAGTIFFTRLHFL